MKIRLELKENYENGVIDLRRYMRSIGAMSSKLDYKAKQRLQKIPEVNEGEDNAMGDVLLAINDTDTVCFI